MATFRLDCPLHARRVTLLALTPDGYARVRTMGSGTMPGFTFETPAARLHRIIHRIIHL